MKNIFLTGASSGIGLATARALLARGNAVWGSSRNPSRIPQLPHLHRVRLDLADARSIHDAFKAALSEAGRFDVVINNAGGGHFGPAENMSAEELAKEFQILVFGHVQLMQLALGSMRDCGSGLIINVTSLASRLPVPFMAGYNSAKAAVAAFSMSIQLELDKSVVRIVDLQPADIRTGFNDSVIKTDATHYEDKVAKTWAEVERNMKTAPKPELVAAEVLKLIEQKNPPPRITVGGTFQAKIAPMIFRVLPQRVRIWGLRMYYGI